MYRIAFILALLFSRIVTYSQDVITKTNGEEIKAKVIEVLQSEIKYKKHDYLDGPLFSIPKSEVFFIKYENGSKDVIKSSRNSAPTKIEEPILRDTIVSEKEKFILSLGPNILLPIAGYKIHSYGYGGELAFSYSVQKNLYIQFLLGYQNLAPKNIDINGTTVKAYSGSLIPIMAGLKYVSQNISIGTSVGFTSYSSEYKASQIRLSFSPQLGYSGNKIEILGHYTNIFIPGFNFSTTGLKFLYKFKF